MASQYGHSIRAECVMYVASYVMKTEKAMGALLKQVTAEVRTDELKVQL